MGRDDRDQTVETGRSREANRDKTIEDAEDSWLLSRLTRTPVFGLAGGTLTPDPVKVLHLSSYSTVRGLAITGTIVLNLARLIDLVSLWTFLERASDDPAIVRDVRPVLAETIQDT